MAQQRPGGGPRRTADLLHLERHGSGPAGAPAGQLLYIARPTTTTDPGFWSLKAEDLPPRLAAERDVT